MVRAPPGCAILGADVDSEELWISRAMGDAQFGVFGLHGATALGWIALEGTKVAGTDLRSNTARILALSRDQAKVFNNSLTIVYRSYFRQMRSCPRTGVATHGTVVSLKQGKRHGCVRAQVLVWRDREVRV